MNYRYLQIDKSTPEIVCISLNRPEKRNALNIEMIQELSEAFQLFPQDPTLRIAILYGTGKTFCVGLDLLESIQTQSIEKMAEAISQMLTTIYSSPLVTIAVLEGDAIAGGAGIVSVCDFAIAAEDVRMGFPEVHRGMVAAVISVFLCRQMPHRSVRQLLLTGDLIDSKQACELGLISHAVARNNLFEGVNDLTQKILKGSPYAFQETKKLLHKLAPTELTHDLETALKTYERVRTSGEAKEGIAAFLEKRDPSWLKVKPKVNL